MATQQGEAVFNHRHLSRDETTGTVLPTIFKGADSHPSGIRWKYGEIKIVQLDWLDLLP